MGPVIPREREKSLVSHGPNEHGCLASARNDRGEEGPLAPVLTPVDRRSSPVVSVLRLPLTPDASDQNRLSSAWVWPVRAAS